ncbi:MAG TPA: alpha/beta hydrolase [Phycicoccus sp.]|nr:alpha/beta hydrolase [Phycicoccus sp.]
MSVHPGPSLTSSHRRRSRAGRVAAVVGVLLLATACSARPSTSAPDEAATSATRGDAPAIPFEGLVDVGNGRQIYATCAGSGSPTVVLIAGKGNGSQDWHDVLEPGDPAHSAPGDDLPFGRGTLVPSDDAVFPAVARGTRVCTYDRPDVRIDGADVTTRRQQPHTVDLDVDDLHHLLAALDEPGPYVLVAHSYGGLIATLYAREFPASIAGLVMVDTVTELTADIADPTALANWDDANSSTSPQSREGVELLDAFDRIKAAGPQPEFQRSSSPPTSRGGWTCSRRTSRRSRR